MDYQNPNKRDNGPRWSNKTFNLQSLSSPNTLWYLGHISETIKYLNVEFGLKLEETYLYNFPSLTQAQFRVKKIQTRVASKPNPTQIQTEHVGVVGPNFLIKSLWMRWRWTVKRKIDNCFRYRQNLIRCNWWPKTWFK